MHYSGLLRDEEFETFQSVEQLYASGEYRLLDSAGLSEHARSGGGTDLVSASRRDAVADDGCYAGVGVRVVGAEAPRRGAPPQC